MVEFFNKKEEVIDLQLTEYGKYLLSLGRLRPEYYAFFDDDILYDPESGGFTEHQNSTEGRIKDETPSLKIVPQITSAETRVNQFVGNVESYRRARLVAEAANAVTRGELTIEDMILYIYELNTTGESTWAAWGGILEDSLAFDQQPFRRTPLSNIDPLGNSSLAKSYAPSWSIEAAIGEISSSANSITVRNASYNVPPSTPAGTDGQAIARVPGPVHEIPQLNIEIDYKTFTKSGNYTVEAISPELNGSVFLAMRPGYFLIDILEENTDYLKENFEIEVFHSGSATFDSNGRIISPLQPGPPDAPALTSLTFLEDSIIATPQNMNDGQVPNVEYYMDVLTDKEIPDSILSYAGVLDGAVSQASTRLRLTRDLYTTENEDPCD